MSSKLNVESFVAVLKKSALVEGDRLTQFVSQFTAQGGNPEDSAGLAEFLVANSVITRWQSEKLLQGKHKGYFLGKYRLLSLLGKGGMSSVYLAEHVLMRRRCALKVLPTKRVNDSSYLARFHREAQAVASLDHPNIVRAYDVDHQLDRDTEIHFLVMEYVEGFSLQELVQKQGNCSFLDSAEYIRQAALGLQNAHEAGMVHRDVKPGNLLVDPNGVVKVLDLGLARFFTGDEGEDALTIRHDEKVLGTADYLAPEQALDSHSVDARADIYSLGCTMYFLLAGRPPFTEGTLAQRLMAHQTKTPPTIESLRPDTPVSLATIVRKMMSKKPEERFQTAREVADALYHWIDVNADPAWRKGHSGIFGPRSTDSSTPRADVPVAKPVVAIPVGAAAATPVQAAAPAQQLVFTPPPQQAGETKPVVDTELTSFFASLSDTQNKKPVKATPAPKSSPRQIPAATAVSPPAVPVAAPVQAPVVAAPVVAPTKPPSTPKLPQPQAQVAPTFPGENGIPDFGDMPSTPVATPRAKPRTEAPSKRLATAAQQQLDRLQKMKLPPPPVLGGIGAGVAVLLLLIVYAMGWIGGGAGGHSAVPQVQWTPDKREVTVGSKGEFKTITDALKVVRRKFEPNGEATDLMIIKIASGTYREAINIDGTPVPRPSRRRNKKAEPPVETEPNWPQGIKLVADGDVILEPTKAEGPVIRLKNTQRFVIEGISIKSNSQPSAIEVVGDMSESRLIGLNVSGFTQSGILCSGASGISFSNGQFVIENITFEPAAGAKGPAGLRIVNTEDSDPGELNIQRCRFLAPLSVGIAISSTGAYRAYNGFMISENIFSGLDDGIRFEGTPQWKNVSVLNNTFHSCRSPLVFAVMPPDGSRDIRIRRNLFSKTSGAEATVQQGYNEGTLRMQLSADFNYTDRARPATPAATEVGFLFEQKGKSGEAGITFASTDAADSKFLAPMESSVQKNVPGAAEGEKSWIGAIGPK